MEGIFFCSTSPLLWNFQLNLIHFFKCFGLAEPLIPQEIPICLVMGGGGGGGVWTFSGTTHFILEVREIFLGKVTWNTFSFPFQQTL